MIHRLSLFGILLCLCLDALAASAPRLQPPPRPGESGSEELQRRLMEEGFKEKVSPLRFELEAWGLRDTLTFAEVNGLDADLANKLWNGDPQKKPKTRKDLLEIADARPGPSPTEMHMLAVLARLKAKKLFGKGEDVIKKELAEWRKAEMDALGELMPHAALKDIGLTPEALAKVVAEGNKAEPKLLAETKLADVLKDPAQRKKLEEILASLPVKEQVKLHASLDQKVEETRDPNINIGPVRSARRTEGIRKEIADRRHEDVPAPPARGAGSFRRPGGHGGGGGGGGGPSGPPPPAPAGTLCEDRPQFTSALSRERSKGPQDRINRPLHIQQTSDPGHSGMCGSSIIDDVAPPCMVDIASAAHCTLVSVDGQGQYTRAPDVELKLQIEGLSGVDVVEVAYPPPFENHPEPGRPPHIAQINTDIVVVRARLRNCSEAQTAAKVRIAARPPLPDESIMIMMNPRMMQDAGCSNGRNCNDGVFAATITPTQFVPPGGRHEVDLRHNSCNHLESGDINSIQPGISGSPAINQFGELVGVNSTKSVFDGADGLVGSIGDAVGFISYTLGLHPRPTPTPDERGAPSPRQPAGGVHGATPPPAPRT